MLHKNIGPILLASLLARIRPNFLPTTNPSCCLNWDLVRKTEMGWMSLSCICNIWNGKRGMIIIIIRFIQITLFSCYLVIYSYKPLNCLCTMEETVESGWWERGSSSMLHTNNLENSWASCCVVKSSPREVINDVGLTQLQKVEIHYL